MYFFYVLLSNYRPQFQKIGMTSGSYEGCPDDDNCDLDRTSIADLLEAKGLTWKNYAEAYTGDCNTAARIGTYARKHTPFMSYVDIQSNPERCANIVNADQLDEDIANNQVPDYVFYTPDVSKYSCITVLRFTDWD